MEFLEIVKYCLLGAAAVLLIIGFIFEQKIVKIEKELWRIFKLWLAEKMRSSERFMMWLNGEKPIKTTYVFRVRVINGWQNERY